jgi:hypothetical protein
MELKEADSDVFFSLLAEHMLPDGAHDRAEDWTVFYLNQIPPLSVDTSLLTRSAVSNGSAASQDASVNLASRGATPSLSNTSASGRDLMYVMSLVRTKKDASVRR